jgi:hypothetical protein
MARQRISVRLTQAEPGDIPPPALEADLAVLLPAAFANDQPLVREHITPESGLTGCLGCGHPELFRKKDFPQAMGIALVVLAAVFAPFTYYLSLAAVALFDALLYFVAGDVLVCYQCRAEHRGFKPTPRHPKFDREIEERLLYGEKAVMGKPMLPGGTADAPEPEH